MNRILRERVSPLYYQLVAYKDDGTRLPFGISPDLDHCKEAKEIIAKKFERFFLKCGYTSFKLVNFSTQEEV